MKNLLFKILTILVFSSIAVYEFGNIAEPVIAEPVEVLKIPDVDFGFSDELMIWNIIFESPKINLWRVEYYDGAEHYNVAEYKTPINERFIHLFADKREGNLILLNRFNVGEKKYSTRIEWNYSLLEMMIAPQIDFFPSVELLSKTNDQLK